MVTLCVFAMILVPCTLKTGIEGPCSALPAIQSRRRGCEQINLAKIFLFNSGFAKHDWTVKMGSDSESKVDILD
jgi:hypothetical protein